MILKLPELIIAILADDLATVKRIIAETPGEAAKAVNIGATRENATEYFVDQLKHYFYAGDTPLHVAAMAYRVEIIELLVKNGADVCARNRRGAEPLHYACDGGPDNENWNQNAQFNTVSKLIELGAAPNSYDKSGVAPLHRAVRNRCTGAVKALVECGADVNIKNKSGSTPLKLAQMTTGKSGSGSEGAKRECALIFDLLTNAGARLT